MCYRENAQRAVVWKPKSLFLGGQLEVNFRLLRYRAHPQRQLEANFVHEMRFREYTHGAVVWKPTSLLLGSQLEANFGLLWYRVRPQSRIEASSENALSRKYTKGGGLEAQIVVLGRPT